MPFLVSNVDSFGLKNTLISIPSVSQRNITNDIYSFVNGTIPSHKLSGVVVIEGFTEK